MLGLGCNFVENGLSLAPGTIGALGLPPFLTSFFDVGIEAENFCLGDGTEFSIDSNDPITSITWDFGDGNTSILENPTHTYGAAGDYTVNVTVTTTTDTTSDSKVITIYENPVANPIADFEICSTSPDYEFDLGTKDAEILGAQSPTEFAVAYYPTLAAAENTHRPIAHSVHQYHAYRNGLCEDSK